MPKNQFKRKKNTKGHLKKKTIVPRKFRSVEPKQFQPFSWNNIFNYASDLTLFCYTDGLTDAINSLDESLTIEDIKACIVAHNSDSPEHINDAILKLAFDHKGELDFTDDIALLTLKVTDLIF